MRSVTYNPKKNIIGLSERGDPVSKVRQVFYLVLECCIFVVLAVVPGVFALQKNVFRQLPLYRFLEGQAVEDLQRQDQETYEKLVESNTRYLGKMVREENKDARVTPGITKTPQITESVKNELEITEAPKPGQDNSGGCDGTSCRGGNCDSGSTGRSGAGNRSGTGNTGRL